MRIFCKPFGCSRVSRSRLRLAHRCRPIVLRLCSERSVVLRIGMWVLVLAWASRCRFWKVGHARASMSGTTTVELHVFLLCTYHYLQPHSREFLCNKKRSFMDTKNPNEELQSRREFFKKAAKAALPVVGITVLSNVPFVDIKATQTSATGCIFGCSGSCSGDCSGTCKNTCERRCTGGCSELCTGGCSGLCTSGCSGLCSGTCKGGCEVTCGNNCGNACSSNCVGNCQSSCYGCKGTCSNTCTGDCSGSSTIRYW